MAKRKEPPVGAAGDPAHMPAPDMAIGLNKYFSPSLQALTGGIMDAPIAAPGAPAALKQLLAVVDAPAGTTETLARRIAAAQALVPYLNIRHPPKLSRVSGTRLRFMTPIA